MYSCKNLDFDNLLKKREIQEIKKKTIKSGILNGIQKPGRYSLKISGNPCQKVVYDSCSYKIEDKQSSLNYISLTYNL